MKKTEFEILITEIQTLESKLEEKTEFIKAIKSQLIDSGVKYDSVLITAINEELKK